MIAIQTTSWLKRRIPHRWWRWVHTTTFAMFALSTVHAFTAGTDAGGSAVRWTGLALAATVVFLTTYRLVAGRRSDGVGEPPAMDTAGSAVSAASAGTRSVVVHELQRAADRVTAITLAAADGAALPSWEPGAHVDLVLPSGKVRQYSLCGDLADTNALRIAVLHVPDGRGGSSEVHQLRPGQQITIRKPRNRFPLVLASHYTFIAGGIGITPILPMVRMVARAGLDWQLVYGGRSRAGMAFADELLTLGDGRVQLVPEDTHGRPDLAAVIEAAPPGAAVYCCGPEPLVTAVEEILAVDFPDRHLHVERFGADLKAVREREFDVELRRSGRVLHVPADRSLLGVIRDAVPDVSSSCGEGVCGSCALRVLDGVPDHRDGVLSPAERDRRDVIYPCVSRSHSPMLVVDR
jgi:ferredoxin-NADP reductase